MTLWEHACKIIPGGSQLYSKRPTRFAPCYPSHFTWAHGIDVVDAETNKTYQDYTTMAVGACTLGYGNAEVDAAVLRAIAAGQNSSLNCIEELEFAEALLKINPKMNMVRFARTGGEACKIAVEICRAYTGRRTYLHAGYSGWLLGKPEQTYGLPINEPEDLPDDHTKYLYACLIMEPVRNYPDESYELMVAARKWCTDNGIPLIFDEITSGFRCNIGGYAYTKNITPDISVFGKALGNGYAISAVVGKEDFMEAAEDHFISSTMWSERIGFAAGLATLQEMKRVNSPDKLIRAGKQFQEGLKERADIAGLELTTHGIYPLTGFEFTEDHNKRITYLTQEMQKKGYLGYDQFYPSILHTKDKVEEYLNEVEEVLCDIAEGKMKLDNGERDLKWKRTN